MTIKVYHSAEHQKLFCERAIAGGYEVLSDEVLKASMKSFIKTHAIYEDTWVFGYGSLIWNPQLNYVDRAAVNLTGLQRKFCLYSTIGYGNPECPGLMLAAEKKVGAICSGIAYKIKKEALPQELHHYWLREMRISAYMPILFQQEVAGEQANIITVVINQNTPNYVGGLNLEQQASLINKAAGPIGKNIDYLDNLIQHLQTYQISDPYLSKLEQAVKIANNT